ncbi:MAG TPA: urea ABC transporter ATP-binding protein UrtD [Halothiobacillus sp.]|jgi:urea transport system ATP-binding protein|nr:urea ABC transporter ATP-binding protein UrtD [Halothiobacillus sp.]HQS28244.1 urea ABC transporter ATP-binding protein UrtD [Halothiobacillus sp.]HUM99302.1 urea ABC transporter ATP-binding protein UrtD [Halothiobacillus sp.]
MMALSENDTHGLGGERITHLAPNEPDVSHGTILYLEDVTLSFDGFKALNKLNLTLDNGELRCIIGPNGAGKSTLMDVITGRRRPQEGRVFFGQNIDLLKRPEHEIASGMVGRKFQRPTVFEALTIGENIELTLTGSRSPWRMLRARSTALEQARIDDVLTTIGLNQLRHRPAGVLSHGQKQWLEIGMLLAQNPRILLVDEPVAGMTGEEVARTAELLVSLAGSRTVVVVEHDMAFVRKIAKKVTVLHQGSVLAEGSLSAVQANPKVIEVYLGETPCSN